MNVVVPEPSYFPIQDMQFKGLHWIEASAGTGKTYTLSSLMVRLLLQDYLPHQVIATTFTRAAAAELKSRIRARLQETLAYLMQCQGLSTTEIMAQKVQETDPLFQVILQSYSDKIGYACERLKLVLDQLDALFVGTLDSFSQKILSEFSFESGRIEHTTISDQAKAYTQQILHDVLREWIQLQPQELVDYLLLNQKLKSVSSYVGLVETTLNFSSAQLQKIRAPDVALADFNQEIERILQLDLSAISQLEAFYAAEGEHYSIVAKKWRDQQALQQLLLHDLPIFLTALAQHKGHALYAPHLANTLKALTELTTKKALNKCKPEVLNEFEQNPIILALRGFCERVQNFELELDLLDSYLKYHLASQVKLRLPQLLQQKGETTFPQQIRHLADALQGEQGQHFAQAVHSRYPLILVDEFQDTNQDQDNMLQQIWRHPKWYATGCMIMVGDPKQAIYGFRGGDMLTYNKARQGVLAQHGCLYSLKYNHRSVAALVDVVDALFQCQPDFGEEVIYSPVQAGSRPHPICYAQQQENPAPLRWLMLDDVKDEPMQVAWKIRDLLNQGIAEQLHFGDSNLQKFIQADDIAVLSKNHDGLDKVQYELNRLGIRVSRASKRSVFDGMVAQDVAAILTAILHPFDERKVKRALLSRLMGFNLQDMLNLQSRPEGLSQYMSDFEHIREMWLTKGFLTAWQYTLNLFRVWENSVRYQSRDNERVVVNLRHLSESLSQHSESYQGPQSLYHWYLKQIQEPGQRDWEMERSLSHHSGVQLMTIHQSKGLEFKIVFLLGANSAAREINKTLNFSTQTTLNPTTGQLELQRIVAVNDKQNLQDADIQQHNARLDAEQHRLWYVALTRASHRVYAVLNKKNKDTQHGLLFWKNSENVFVHEGSQTEDLLLECPFELRSKQAQTPVIIEALDLPKQRFYPRAKTSFSALSQHLGRQQAIDALAAQRDEQQGARDEHAIAIVDIVVTQPLAWIKRNFPMGTVAGNFLHEIFEHIDFKDSSDWRLELHRRFKNAYPMLWQELQQKYLQEFGVEGDDQLYAMLVEWLSDILSTPLYDGFQLNQLVDEQHLAEFPFYLSLSDHVLGVQRIQQLFLEYDIEILPLNAANSARYLNGSIDLVYYDGRRYHIADYKSNFLGLDQRHYSSDSIQANMSQSSYWLQAGLYLVALHRYLSVHFADYDMARDLGGASYLYLRGMNGQAMQGMHYWKPTDEFVLRLDALLGSFKVQVSA